MDTRVLAGGAILLLFLAFITWQMVRDRTASPEEIERRITFLSLDCRAYAGAAIRQEILTGAEPLEMDNLDDILDTVEDLTVQECETMNAQINATAP